jgi:hypothetical protein
MLDLPVRDDGSCDADRASALRPPRDSEFALRTVTRGRAPSGTDPGSVVLAMKSDDSARRAEGMYNKKYNSQEIRDPPSTYNGRILIA